MSCYYIQHYHHVLNYKEEISDDYEFFPVTSPICSISANHLQCVLVAHGETSCVTYCTSNADILQG